MVIESVGIVIGRKCKNCVESVQTSSLELLKSEIVKVRWAYRNAIARTRY